MNRTAGWTVIEMVMILAVLAILLGITVYFVRGTATFARPYAAGVAAARLRAATTGTHVAIGPHACAFATDRVTPDPTPARVSTFPTRGLVFTPDGLPRTCDGGGVGNTTILLEHRGRQAAVIVSSLGRVRWEPR